VKISIDFNRFSNSYFQKNEIIIHNIRFISVEKRD